MAKTFEFTFSINGLVSQGFTGSMTTARNGLIKLGQQGQELKAKLKELDAAHFPPAAEEGLRSARKRLRVAAKRDHAVPVGIRCPRGGGNGGIGY